MQQLGLHGTPVVLRLKMLLGCWRATFGGSFQDKHTDSMSIRGYSSGVLMAVPFFWEAFERCWHFRRKHEDFKFPKTNVLTPS